MVKEIRWLLTKEFLIEWRQRSALAGLLLYAVSTVFVCYLSFRILDDIFTWNALFWVMVLFGAINAGARSFIQESHGLQFYYYTVASPQAIILSKIIYNMVLLAAISLVNYMAMSLFLGNPVDDPVSYLLILIPGSTGLSGVITLVSAIASKAGKNTAMMAILSFPLLMPLLITLIKASRFALLGTPPSEYMGYVGILLLLNVIVWVLSFLLFPYLWHD
ncbi:MAG: heme exporter protein CcmB [Flavobacteriales bacterium]|nr:heme exporter protein CcmB [Flavobacteriales bacterium]MCB9448917.1 heme exporter protein CcmB [Flavobacteriales bacterium]